MPVPPSCRMTPPRTSLLGIAPLSPFCCLSSSPSLLSHFNLHTRTHTHHEKFPFFPILSYNPTSLFPNIPKFLEWLLCPQLRPRLLPSQTINMNIMKNPSDFQVAKSRGQVLVLILFQLHHSLLLDPSLASGSASLLAFFFSPCPHLPGSLHPTFTIGALLSFYLHPLLRHCISDPEVEMPSLCCWLFNFSHRPDSPAQDWFIELLAHVASPHWMSQAISSLTNPHQGIL